MDWWADYFSKPMGNGGLPAQFLKQGKELEELTAFFAWTAWASVTNRPGETQTYTNNFPYDPLAGNVPTGSARALERDKSNSFTGRYRARAVGLRQV